MNRITNPIGMQLARQMGTPYPVKTEIYNPSQHSAPMEPVKIIDYVEETESSSEEEITLSYIIEERPSTKLVRDFFRLHLSLIKSEEEKMFSGI